MIGSLVQAVICVLYISLSSGFPSAEPSPHGYGHGHGHGYGHVGYGHGHGKRAAHGHGYGHGHGHGGYHGGFYHGKRSASNEDPSDHIFISEGHLWNLEDYHEK